MGGKKDERESTFSTLTFPFLHIPPSTLDSPDHPSGITTPPLQTSASIPFKWEEQPGKPRPCPGPTPRPEPAKSLDLPPCRARALFPKTPSPTTVLDGPYNVGRPKFSSFRLFREAHDSFDSFSCGSTPEGLDSGKKGAKTGGLFGKFRGGKKGPDGGSCRFSPSSVSSYESEERCVVGGKNDGGVKMRSKSSFNSAPHAAKPHLWTSIYEGIKHAVRWKSSRRVNKEGRD